MIIIIVIIRLDVVYHTTYPVELIGFDENEVMSDPELLAIIYDFVDVDGRGKEISSIFPDISPLRVVELRRRFYDYQIRGGLIIVLGTYSTTEPQKRYVSFDVYQLRSLLNHQQYTTITTTSTTTSTNTATIINPQISLLTEEVSLFI